MRSGWGLGDEGLADRDPLLGLDATPMSVWQWFAVAIAVGLNALDGFDVLSISFAAPGIAKAWHLNRADLGIVLSMELIGMAAGSLVLGRMADRYGRRPVILTCLLTLFAGMTLAATSQSVWQLCLWRILTGLGVGGMLAAVNAATAEFANARWRSLCVSMMVIGYPVGSVIGGTICAALLRHSDWRVVFEVGAAATALFIPLTLFWVPETPAFLALPRHQDGATATSITELFKKGLRWTTILITLAYFMHFASHYFILKWAPKIVADMGFAQSSAAGVLVQAQIGGTVGGVIFGLLSQKISLRGLTISALCGAGAMLILFGHGQADLNALSWMAFATVMFTNSGIVGLYAMLALVFPTHVRATGTGFVIGVGRGAAALAPILVGWLFNQGQGLQVVTVAMAGASLIAAVALLGVRYYAPLDVA